MPSPQPVFKLAVVCMAGDACALQSLAGLLDAAPALHWHRAAAADPLTLAGDLVLLLVDAASTAVACTCSSNAVSFSRLRLAFRAATVIARYRRPLET